MSYLIFDFICLTLSSTDTHEIAKYARTYIRDTHTQAHTQKKKKEKVERLERLEETEVKSRKTKKKCESGKKERRKTKKRKDEKKGS